MGSVRESYNSNFRLIQYFNLRKDRYAKRLFHQEFDINRQYSDSNDLEFSGCTALHFAAKLHRKCDIEFLLSRGADPTIQSQSGLTPLRAAIKDIFIDSKDVIYCKLLLSAQVRSGNAKNPSDKNGLSHFHIACMSDHSEAVEFFLNNGVFVNGAVNIDSPYFPGYTPLHLAARHSGLEAMKVLLRYGASTQLKNAEGMKVLCTLFQMRVKLISESYSNSEQDANVILINFLLQYDTYPMDYAGLTHFHIACSSTELSIVERLLQEISDINHAMDMDAPHWPGCIALHFAAQSSIEMVKLLVVNGANLLAKDAKGVTPLDICFERYKLEDIRAVLSLDVTWRSILMSDRKTRLLTLVEAMEDADQFDNFLERTSQVINTFVLFDSPTWQGFTPLHIAVTFYDREGETDARAEGIIEKLMARGANINSRDINGRTSIHLAQRFKGASVALLLLEYRDQIEDAVDDENLSHLHIACQAKDAAAVEKILQTAVDVNVAFRGKFDACGIRVGSTPLHCAVPNDEIIALLLSRGADPLLKDADGMTAIHRSTGHSNALLFLPNLPDCVVPDSGLSYLHLAVQHGNLDAVKTLLDNGADINRVHLRAGQGQGSAEVAAATPLDFSLFRDAEMMKLLMRRGAEVLAREPVVVDREASYKLSPFVSTLNSEDNLFGRLEKEIGLTILHVACYRRDVDLIKALIASGANVNARINVKSRLWPGYTALHVVMDDLNHYGNLDGIVRLLLNSGADVSLTTCDEEETAVYVAYKRIRMDLRATENSNRYSCIRMLLRAHEDFTVNPTRPNCLSYFHIACALCDTGLVERFLRHGADVNQPTDFLKHSKFTLNTPGSTPLLLAAAINKYDVDAMSQLMMVCLLLNYGADVDAQDVHGNTVLHLMAQWNYDREGVILSLVRAKANVNLRNVWNSTPFEVMMTSNRVTSMIINKRITVDNIKFFLRLGCSFNVYNCITDTGLIAIALAIIPFEDLLYVLKMLYDPRLMKTDHMGRTVMHNMVSFVNVKKVKTNQGIPLDSQYITLIDELGNFDLDVDDQDKFGRTPLHLAAHFRNFKAICALLNSGADVNVIDASGKTAFAYIFDSCVRCSKSHLIANHSQFDHSDLFVVFVDHMQKLGFCGLDLNETNKKLLFEAFRKCSEDLSLALGFEDQLTAIRNIIIPRTRLTLENFLSESDAIATYPSLPKIERDAVDKYFKDEIHDLRKTYNEVANIVFFQYRKAMKREKLNRLAHAALNILARIRVPDLCAMEILKLLTNLELSSMIEAAV